MTTFLYTTTSEGGAITDPDGVRSIVSSYYFTVEPTVTDDRIVFSAEAKPNSAFGVYATEEQRDSRVEEFFEGIAQYLQSELSVRCVEVQGNGPPAAWEWTVGVDGYVSRNDL